MMNAKQSRDMLQDVLREVTVQVWTAASQV